MGREHHRTTMPKKKKRPYHQPVVEEKVSSVYIDKYLHGQRKQAIEEIKEATGNDNLNELKPHIKKGIYSYVSRQYPDFEGSVNIKSCIYNLLQDFKMTEFTQRNWQYHPYYINVHAYKKLQQSQKFPIYISNYDYDSPLYTLSNNFIFNNRKKAGLNRYSEEKIKNDVQFYLAPEQKILCAKVITLRYKPLNLQLIKKRYRAIENAVGAGILCGEIAQKQQLLTEHDALYSRSLSLSMYVMLDGDPEKAMSFIRFDDEEGEHTNVYIGDDKRRKIYGERAEGPHFHFQNETDSLLCLRKFSGEETRKYRTGRCNAIDCPHLKSYLQFLDGLDKAETERQLEKNLHYGMPFLEMKLRDRAPKTKITARMYEYIENLSDTEKSKIHYVQEWINSAKQNPQYKNEEGRKFGKIIMTLDFFTFINEKRREISDLEERSMLTQIELVTANALISTFANCEEKELSTADDRYKYQINGNHLEEIDTKGENENEV